jgi:hypothetical protein
MRFSDKFSSGLHLKPAALRTMPFRGSIVDGVFEEVSPLREDEYTVSFKGVLEILVLTPTNGGIVARAGGDDTQAGVGEVINLVMMSGTGTFDGKIVNFIELPVDPRPSAPAAVPPDDDDI